MRIVIDDYLGRAPPVQLSRALAARGHDVLHLYSMDVQTPKADLLRKPDDPPNLTIEGLAHGLTPSGTFLGRRRQESKVGRMTARRVLEFRPDVVMAANNPLDVQRHIQAACARKGIRFIYWMQEFYALKIDQELDSHSAFFSILAGGYYHQVERRTLHRSDAIIPITHDLRGVLAENWGVYDRQCMVVRNWSPLNEWTPGSRQNEWSTRQGLAGKKTAIYTGSLGAMEDPALLVQLAERLQHRPDIQIVVVSEGAGAEHVTREAAARSLSNLQVLPFQPYAHYGDVLASADVLLALVDASAGILFAPSKINSYLCAGRPVVLASPWQNLAATTVRESNGGRVVPPGDAAAMADAVVSYLDDDALRAKTGEQARRYAESEFDISPIADRFENLFNRLVSGQPRRRQSKNALTS